jgi:PIN domain nuclease of toxin-antitoxin system
MNYLLDTSVLLHSMGSKEKLARTAVAIIEDDDSVLHLSAATVWEITIKAAIGKLPLPVNPADFIASSIRVLRLVSVPVTQLHALAVFQLPFHHGDPFDRMLIAQAQLENLTLLTADRAFQKYDLKIVNCRK